MTMSDHEDNESFTYSRSWEEIEVMLHKAERKKNQHLTSLQTCHKNHRMYHMRNYKALEGVTKTLRWVLGDLRVQHPLE